MNSSKVKTITVRYTEDKRVFDFIKAQDNLSDSIIYLIQQEILANGVRNLQYFIPAKRSIDALGFVTGECCYRSVFIPGVFPVDASEIKGKYFTTTLYVKKNEDKRVFEFVDVQDNFADSVVFLIQKEIYENGVRNLAEFIPQKRPM